MSTYGSAWTRRLQGLLMLLFVGSAAAEINLRDPNPDFVPNQALGVDQSVDYQSLIKFGPWDDRNYQLRAADVRLLPADDRYVPGVPVFFKVQKRAEMIEQGFPLSDIYPREFDKEFEIRFGGLIQDGVHYVTERGRENGHDPARKPTLKLLATDPIVKAAPVLGQGPFDGTLSNNETTIEYHPTNPSIVVAGSNGSGGQRMSFSTDGGVSWGNSGALPGTCCDPAIEFTSNGNIVFAATLGQAASGCGFSLCSSVYWSFNGGQNWLGPVHTSTASSDKEWIHVDRSPSSPFQDRVYLTWHQSNVMQFARSTALPVNGGTPLAFAPTISFASDERGIGSDIATDSQGRVYYAYPSITSGSAEIYVLRSDDGGVTFLDMDAARPGLGRMAYDLHGRFDFAIPAMESRRVFIYTVIDVDRSGGPRNGRIYIAFTDENAAAGSPGNGTGSAAASHGWIQVIYSDDQGMTWSTATTPHSTADQTTVDRFQPWMKVDQLGNVHVGWQDTRNSGAGARNKADWYYAVSSDGGATWIEETRVSDVVSENINNGQEWGDYNGLAISPDNSTVAMTWTDNRIVTPPSTTSQRSFVGRVQNVVNGPTYLMDASATSFNLCAGTAVPNIPVNLTAIAGYAGSVTLSTPGLNNAVFPSATFSPNPVSPAPGGTASTLSMTTNPAAAAGSYVVNIQGTDAGGTPIVRADSFSVNLAAGTPGIASLTAPADGATSVAVAPSLTWAAVAGAQQYLVEVATDAGFTNIVRTGTVSGTSFVPSPGLAPNTQHFWRVRAQNACGNAAFSTVRSFTTVNELCFNGSVAIPDNNTTGIENTLAGFAGNINDLNVTVQINHTWVGDITVSLRRDPVGGPAGTPVVLIERPGSPATANGCSSDNINVVLDDSGTGPVETACSATPPAISGTLTPNNPLSAFTNQDFAGNWVLNVRDTVGSDVGNLVRWCLQADIATAAPNAIFENGFE